MSVKESYAGKINRKLNKKLHVIDVAAGRVDMTLFEPGAAADLDALVNDPARFVRSRDALRLPAGEVARYLALGGVPLLAKALRFKAHGHSVRRTNQEGAAL